MIDILKFSKKSKILKFLITKILRINVQLLSKPLFFKHDVFLNLKEEFFYAYKKKSNKKMDVY